VRLDFRDHVTGIPRFGLPEIATSPTAPFFPAQGRAQDFEISTGLTYYFTGRNNPPENSARNQNFTIELRVSVLLLVTTAGPPLNICQAAYCSMYVSSDDRQSTGTITL
jgi:hypothetical protein